MKTAEQLVRQNFKEHPEQWVPSSSSRSAQAYRRSPSIEVYVVETLFPFVFDGRIELRVPDRWHRRHLSWWSSLCWYFRIRVAERKGQSSEEREAASSRAKDEALAEEEIVKALGSTES